MIKKFFVASRRNFACFSSDAFFHSPIFGNNSMEWKIQQGEFGQTRNKKHNKLDPCHIND